MAIGVKAAITVVSVLLVGAGGAALVAGSNGLWRALPGGEIKRAADSEHKAEVKAGAQADSRSDTQAARAPQLASAAPDAPLSAAPSSNKSDDTKSDVTASTTPQSKLGDANAALAALAAPSAPAAEESGPRFDVARVDQDGEAVIAGRAAPGAKVDLLRDGVTHDQAIADASGQFVMAPPRLPPGNYNLTLKATAPDGSVAQSKASVQVAVNEQSMRVASARDDVANTAPLKTPTAQGAAGFALANPPTEKGPVRKHEETTGSIASRVVVRGDSLWLISRHAYGDGARYALIFKANRDKIRNPDRIYPGQTFVVPKKEQ